MADWKKRAKKLNDVVYFPYAKEKDFEQAPEVYVWDVDKTYLDTKFETLRGLLRTATEKAQQKRNIPGTAELVSNMEKAWALRKQTSKLPMFFVTASPPQMENKIRAKLDIDEVHPVGIFFKDNLANLRPRRFWRLNKQVGYKLQALLQLRTFLKSDVKVILFGDDGESDAIIYSLFSDICSRRLDTSELRRILNSLFVLDDQVDTIFHLQEEIPPHDPVEKIYINLIDDTDADYYLKFGRRILPTSSSLQAALDLFQDQRLFTEQVISVAKTLINQYDFTTEEIENQVDDLIRRSRLSAESYEQLAPYMNKM
jgi:hypothetical protein